MSLKIKQISDFVSGVAAQPVGTATQTAITAEANARIAADGTLSTALSSELVARAGADTTLSTAVSSEVAARISAVSGVQSDVDTNQSNIESALSSELVARAGADTTLSTAVSSEVAARISAVSGVQSDVDTNQSNIEGALSTELVARANADTTLDGKINTEKGRIDALLLNSTGTLDTFAEITTFINGLSTADVSQLEALSTAVSNDVVHASAISTAVSNDVVHASAISTAVSNDVVHSSGISANASAISGFGTVVGSNTGDFATAAQGATADSALQPGEAYGDTALTVTEAELNLLDGLTATAAELNQLDGVTVGDILASNIADFATAAQGTKADAAATEVDLTTAENRITALEGYIMEDTQMYVETFVGRAAVAQGPALDYALAHPVQDNFIGLVDAYINGHRVEVFSVVGNAVQLKYPGYVIDVNDSILISYQG
jgi:hypothetical protein